MAENNSLPLEQLHKHTKYDPYAKRWQRSGGLQCQCIYRIELDSSVGEIARKQNKDAVDDAELNGHVKIY